MSGVDKLYYESICAKFSKRDPTRYYGKPVSVVSLVDASNTVYISQTLYLVANPRVLKFRSLGVFAARFHSTILVSRLYVSSTPVYSDLGLSDRVVQVGSYCLNNACIISHSTVLLKNTISRLLIAKRTSEVDIACAYQCNFTSNVCFQYRYTYANY